MRFSSSFVLNHLIKKKSKQRIRVLVGQNKLKKAGIKNLSEIYEKFSNFNFNLFTSDIHDSSKNFYLKLKVLKGIKRRTINRKIYYYSSFKKKKKYAVIPLPKEYLKIIHESTSLDISYFLSSLKFKFLVLRELLKSIILFLQLLKYSFNENNNIRNNSIYFYDLMPSTFSDDEQSFLNQITERDFQEVDYIFVSKDFMTLLNNRKFKLKSKIIPTNFPFGSFGKDTFKILRFTGYFLKDFTNTVIKFFFIGSWHSMYLLPEITKYRYASILSKNNIPKEHFQSQSDFMSRELWSVNFNESDKIFSIFFYATSIIPLYFKNKPTSTKGYFWNVMNWDRAYLQEQYCINFLKEKNSLIKDFILVNPFSWSDWCAEKHSYFNVSNSITFFDLAPHNFYTGLSQGEMDWKQSFRNGMEIIEILGNISAALNIEIIVKLKRKTRFLNKRYSRKLESMKKLKVVTNIDPSYLANQSICSLSACFTSTANLDSRKKSIYFDPSKMIVDPYKISYQHDILNTEQELKNRILFYLNQSK